MNAGGVAGAWFADLFLFLFGYLAYLFPVMMAYTGWLIYRRPRSGAILETSVFMLRWVGFLMTIAAGTGLASLHFDSAGSLPEGAGGILGDVTGQPLVGTFSFLGATLFLLALLLASVTLLTGLSWFGLMDTMGRLTLTLLGSAHDRVRQVWEMRLRQARATLEGRNPRDFQAESPKRVTPIIKSLMPAVGRTMEHPLVLFESPPQAERPPLSLLDAPRSHSGGYSEAQLSAMSREVELKLRDFGVEAEVVAVQPGPVITRFELLPAPGVKVSRISNLTKDLARSLSTISVRVVEVIPGKSVIGLEVPNQERQVVALSDIFRSREYKEATSALTLALGQDIGGAPVVVDLAKMPHLLAAGTTGSGKSVGLNVMVLSFLFKTTPKDVRLIMIDPKMLELSVYEGIPHLLTPVVTDMKEAANALRWCVGEMERRYRLMAALGVRHIAGFNRKVKDAADAGHPIPDPLQQSGEPELNSDEPPPVLGPLPYIVVIVDELADMMMIVGKKVEELIARLAQKARASGINLILATQRPSVDVITGLIKANIPTRIAFQVSSKVDSRTILDQSGAEALLGQGDMLYLAPGTGIPTRVHGAFVADHEVHKVVNHLRQRGQPEYLEDIVSDAGEDSSVQGEFAAADSAEADPLYDQAVRIVTETRRASISGVQRRLKIGYNRAARMIEEMERAGIVGALQANGSREVLAALPPED
jgi:DNA segregation ATPase FtsK/SpoIIIE and related proteins